MRAVATIAVLAGATLALAGCGGGEPDIYDVEKEAELRVIRLDDGREIECLFYAKDGPYQSWLAFDCDWNPR